MAKKVASCLVAFDRSLTAIKPPRTLGTISSRRYETTSSGQAAVPVVNASHNKSGVDLSCPARLFERLSTASLIRSVILGQIFKAPMLFNPGLYILEKVANSTSIFLNADKNPLLRAVLYPLIYKHFCAGRTPAEVAQTIASIKDMGYSGVILCYCKEIVASKDGKDKGTTHTTYDGTNTQWEVQQWSEGNLATLAAVGQGDYIGVKYTGAGLQAAQDLEGGKPPSPEIQAALRELCDRARAEHKRLWIDAEQQLYHPTIDSWTIDLMRQHNRDGQVVVLNTIQAYLKSSRQTVEQYLRLAQREGWTLGIKLVRGAYIASDVRSRIHDTKAETDACYDSIAHDLLIRSWPGFDKASFPKVKLFVAGHNANSVRKVATLAQQLAKEGSFTEPVQYGQLQGMADDIGCELLALGDRVKDGAGKGTESGAMAAGAPEAFKCLTWGTLQDCLHFLVRRAVENRSAAERLNTGLAEMKRELWRRMWGFRRNTMTS